MRTHVLINSSSASNRRKVVTHPDTKQQRLNNIQQEYIEQMSFIKAMAQVQTTLCNLPHLSNDYNVHKIQHMLSLKHYSLKFNNTDSQLLTIFVYFGRIWKQYFAVLRYCCRRRRIDVVTARNPRVEALLQRDKASGYVTYFMHLNIDYSFNIIASHHFVSLRLFACH